LSVIGEDAEFVDGAEAVLDRAHQPVRAAGLALEIEHGVDHVLQHPRPGQRALLGDMADQEHGGVGELGVAHQLRGALAHLRDGARGRGQGIGEQGLDGVDDQHPRALRRAVARMLDAGLRQQADMRGG
jgi:hypothetical protein